MDKWDRSKTELLQWCQKITGWHLVEGKRYSRTELEAEIENETDLGVMLIENYMNTKT